MNYKLEINGKLWQGEYAAEYRAHSVIVTIRGDKFVSRCGLGKTEESALLEALKEQVQVEPCTVAIEGANLVTRIAKTQELVHSVPIAPR